MPGLALANRWPRFNFPTPLPLPALSCFPLPFLPLAAKTSYRGLGERCKLPSGVRDTGPAAVALCCVVCSQNASGAALISAFVP